MNAHPLLLFHMNCPVVPMFVHNGQEYVDVGHAGPLQGVKSPLLLMNN
jgi:hypothetical protein